MSKLLSEAIYVGGAPLQAVPLPNSTPTKLDTASGPATMGQDLGDKTIAFSLTLTDPHYIQTDGSEASATNFKFKVPNGTTFWTRRPGDVRVSLFPESGQALNGDSQQIIGEYRKQ